MIDGNNLFVGCALGLSECSETEPCPLHDQFLSIRDELNKVLQDSNLLDTALGLNEGLTVLKR